MTRIYLFGNGLSLAFNEDHYALDALTSRVRDRLSGMRIPGGEPLLNHLEEIATALRPDLSPTPRQSFEEIAGPVDRLANTLSEFGPLVRVATNDQRALPRRTTPHPPHSLQAGRRGPSGKRDVSSIRHVRMGSGQPGVAAHVAAFPPGQEGLVFTDPQGWPLRRSNFRHRVWLSAVRSAELAPLRFHDLRHTAAALAIKAGAHPKAIAERLGHASITTTLNTSGHLFPALDEELVRTARRHGTQLWRGTYVARTRYGGGGDASPRWKSSC